MKWEDDPLIVELSNIYDKCRELIEQRNHIEMIPYMLSFIEEPDEIIRLNKIKTILVITKNVPNFFPEITEARATLLAEHNKIHDTLK